MRNFLLGSAAVIGLVGTAAAQPATPMPMGVMGMPAQPQPYLGGNNANGSEGTMPKSATAPVPGSVVIHLNGRVWFEATLQGSGVASDTGGNKLQPYQFQGYARLYPGFDAMATNGLRYGGIIEIRQNFGAITGSPASSGASGSSSASTLYFRREAVYIGSDSIGIFRLGQDDGPISQFDGGVTTFQGFGSGGWNGDGPGPIPGAAQPIFPWWSGIGNEYTISKAVYLSPNIAGFDFGLSYAPNNGTNHGSINCSVAGTGCASLSSSTLPSDSWRATNMVNIQGRYRGTVGPVGIYATAGYVFSGHVHTTAPSGDLGDNFSVGDFGIALTFGGFTFGGHALVGDYNGQVALKPKGGEHAVAWLVGAQYVNGPITVGASYYNYQSQGAAAKVGISQRYDDAFAAGVTYSVAPGLIAYADYLYGQLYQGGVNQVTGATTGPSSLLNNSMHSQSFLVGTRVQW